MGAVSQMVGGGCMGAGGPICMCVRFSSPHACIVTSLPRQMLMGRPAHAPYDLAAGEELVDMGACNSGPDQLPWLANLRNSFVRTHFLTKVF